MIINVSTLYNVKISCSLPVLMMQYGTLSLKDIAVITRKQPFAHHYDGAWLILIGSLWVRILAGGNHRMKAAPLPPPPLSCGALLRSCDPKLRPSTTAWLYLVPAGLEVTEMEFVKRIRMVGLLLVACSRSLYLTHQRVYKDETKRESEGNRELRR